MMQIDPIQFRNRFVFVLGLFVCSLSAAQSSLQCLDNDTWLPVYEVRGKTPYCFTGDDLVRGDSETLTMLSSEEFGDGFLEVKIIENARSGVVNTDGFLRFTAERGWFQFSAKVKSTVDIDDAYFVMRLDCYGEASYICGSLGSLKAGKSRTVAILTQLQYEMPKQLHFFSGSSEIRSDLIPTNYRYEYGTFLLASN